MAHHSMFDPDAANQAPAAEGERAQSERSFSVEEVRDKLDLVELAEKFTVHGGGRVSAEVSTDLALDLVLNQIAEQACLATPASGAAIVLARDGEWVCRASAGGNTPTLGARLDAEAGLSGECIKTRQTQRCDDAQSDPRADIEACRSLGVRSVLILPLQDDELVGVFEVFSSQPAAFGKRDESTLEVLAQRVLTSLKQTSLKQTSQALPVSAPSVATEPVDVSAKSPGDSVEENSGVTNLRVENAIVDNFAGKNDGAKDASEYSVEDAPIPEATSEVVPGRHIHILTWILGMAVLAFALLLTALIGMRLFAGKTAARVRPRADVSSKVSDAVHNPASDGSAAKTDITATKTKETPTNLAAGNRTGSAGSGSAGSPNAPESAGTPASTVPHPTPAPPKAGSLQVFEKGKEIFRLPPGAEEGERSNSGATTVEPSPVQRAAIYELSPEAVSGSLLYRVEPEYPQEALTQQIQGPVTLDVRIARDGTVQTVNSVHGQRFLADAAITAVKQWKFKPHVVKGQAVEMQTTITLNFRLPR